MAENIVIALPDTVHGDQNAVYIKRLIWVYFWLLICEGALRKWVVPQLSTPLLVVRDPVVLLSYYFALRGGLFPRNLLTQSTICLAYIFAIGGFLQVIESGSNSLPVILFGLRTDFLHLPLIFLIPKVFADEDLKKLGWWFLALAVPMAVLMVLQFQAPPSDFLNRGAGDDAAQITSVMGKIRPAGTFSFISGPIVFFGTMSAFLIWGFLQRGLYSTGLLIAAGGGLLTALAVSASRSAVGGVLAVLIACAVGLLAQPGLITRSIKPLLVFSVLVTVLGSTQFFNEGLSVTNTRFEMANANDDPVERFVGGFFVPLALMSDVPLLGRGLGLGTNAGSAIYSGKVQFSLGEGEWDRVLNESGPLLGLSYLMLRVAIAACLGRASLRSMLAGRPLALLLFGACALNVVSGQFGQPTSLGFAVFGAGLCLAAAQIQDDSKLCQP